MPDWFSERASRWLVRARATFSGRREKELRAELELHLDLLEEEYTAQGLSPDAARRLAHRDFGNATLYREASHDLFSFRPIEDLVQDLHYAVRELRRTIGFTCIAVGHMVAEILRDRYGVECAVAEYGCDTGVYRRTNYGSSIRPIRSTPGWLRTPSERWMRIPTASSRSRRCWKR